MHAVLVTFRSSATPEEVQGPFDEYAQAMGGVEGLVMKTWITDGERVGGFHVFESKEAADRYFAGSLYRRVKDNPAFSDFEVREFVVFDGWSQTTGTPTRVLGRAPAAVA